MVIISTDATLTIRKAGKTPMEYMVIKLKKLLVTSVSTGGSGGEDRLTENITLNFAEIYYDYKEQKPDGSLGAAKSFKWNISGNDQI